MIIGVFQDGKVSDPYATKDHMLRCNAWRAHTLYTVVESPTKEGFNLLIKRALTSLRKVRHNATINSK